jgi:RNA polymerase sigma-70 factor (ECF subfamily)
MKESGDDAELVSRCLRGEAEAFEPLVERYQGVLFNVALRMVGDYEDARDITQNAFVKAYEKLATYDPRFRFFSWIYRIMVNESLNSLERRKPHQPLDPALASTEDPLEKAQAEEQSRKVQDALMELPVDQREALILRHFAELSYAEMALALGITEKTVKSRLYEARQRLGEVLARRSART